uniref:CASP-like protein n=1 Tax=Quercus lobata TaxID=97700 RepID=A0A7N2LLT7_QUELO
MVSERRTGEAERAEAKVGAAEMESGGTMSGPLVGMMITSSRPLDHHDLYQNQTNNNNNNSKRKCGSDVGHVVLRLLCMLTSLAALSFMVTASQSNSISIYGFQFPIHSKWSFSHSFEFQNNAQSDWMGGGFVACVFYYWVQNDENLFLKKLNSFSYQPNGALARFLVGVSAAVAAHSLLQLLISASRLLRNSPVIPSRNHAWLIFAGDQVFAYAMISAGSAASGVTNLNRTGIRHTALPNFCKYLHSFCDHVAISIAFTFFSCILLAMSAVQDVIWLSKN